MTMTINSCLPNDILQTLDPYQSFRQNISHYFKLSLYQISILMMISILDLKDDIQGAPRLMHLKA